MLHQYMEIAKGSTSQLARILVRDTTSTNGEAGLTGLAWNSAGLTAVYTRHGDAADTSITLATMTEGTWATGGFVEMDATDLAGMYEVGIVDAALASGADFVDMYFYGATNMDPVVLHVKLVDPTRAPIVIDWVMLEQSTTRHMLVGPLINIETGAPITSVTLGDITCARVRQFSSSVLRASVTLAASGDNQFTHVADGYYEFDITTSDTASLGNVTFTFRDDDLFHPIECHALVVPSTIWDSLVGGGDTLPVDVTQWLGTAVTAATAGRPDVNLAAINDDTNDAADLGAAVDNTNNLMLSNVSMISGDSTAADNAELFFDGAGYAGGATRMDVNIATINGNSDAAATLQHMMNSSAPSAANVFTIDESTFPATTTQFEVSAGDATDDHYNNGRIRWVSGVLFGAEYDITDYDGTNLRFTVGTMTDSPSGGDQFVML